MLHGMVGWIEDLVNLPQDVLDLVEGNGPGEVFHVHPVAQDLSFLRGEEGFPQARVVEFDFEVEFCHNLPISSVVGPDPLLVP